MHRCMQVIRDLITNKWQRQSFVFSAKKAKSANHCLPQWHHPENAEWAEHFCPHWGNLLGSETPLGQDDFSFSYNKHENPGPPQTPQEAKWAQSFCWTLKTGDNHFGDNHLLHPSVHTHVLGTGPPGTKQMRGVGSRKNAKLEAKNLHQITRHSPASCVILGEHLPL